ncbi:MAG TPA: PIN domain-containing protein [Novosphingobium sp.]|nr:PIN domain-containing protein [Novosphingobium sp.]
MIVIDTNVLSQPMRANGDARVNDWLDRNFDQVGIPVLALSEIVYGIELIDDWERKIQLTNAWATIRMRFEDRFVPFDMAAADAHGWLQAKMKRNGGRLPEIDSQIAAIAISRGAKVATRNIRDFAPTGVELINPWED